MSLDGYHTILVLGGIRSGKSEFAESLVNGATEVRYVATATPATDDPEWAARLDAHRGRRPATWVTEETGASPGRLMTLLTDAKPDQTLLIDDLGGWLTAVLEEAGWSAGTERGAVTELVGAVRDCVARVVIVSPEVGMSVIPATESGRAFADAVGSANRLLAEACDGVVLVVAGQPGWLKPAPAGTPAVPVPAAGVSVAVSPAEPVPPVEPVPPAEPLTATAAPTAAPAEGAVPEAAASEPAVTEPVPAETAVPSRSLSGSLLTLKDQPQGVVIELDGTLPLPDEEAASAAGERLAALNIAGPGLGNLTRAATFAAGVQGTASPRPFGSVRVLLLHGDHAGGVAAGDNPDDWAERVRQSRQGAGPLGLLATQAGARLEVVDLGGPGRTPVAAPIEDGLAASPTRVDAALREGLRLADAAIDEGTDLIVLAAAGAGQHAAAAAVVAANVTAGPAALLPRVYQPGGKIDDEAWMVRCGAIRDALRGMRGQARDARAVLAALAGEDIAVGVGVLIGASARRVPVLIDGPVGIAAAVTARDISAVTRHWTLLAEHGDHPTVKAGADMLGATPLLDLRFGLGEGVAALAALPLIQSTLSIVDGV
ncbi:bifunctional adenosylcobinamide kinase/adenosylcobinamide-phosphate guanylyltransferase [Rugosimonospora africana]|uniref:Adenosylcobinamide kinase n=1 Tax=Rugosimonospora africana TaxID=556532 RepID=A0A8J3QZH8_9ACTN|nr:bifunctional adenosylcobinamide kinase/adenosylcobinamide-phosphate guanylyltransferase [Rugosimonospora africana]GIH18743.1 hypothetical protein Raf01_69150 [Rugosimonospora africana]